MAPARPAAGAEGIAVGLSPLADAPRHGRTLGTVLSAASLAIAACGQSPATTGESSPRSPVISSAAGPPGTSLGDGFSVVEGTVLVGPPIPIGIAVVSNGKPILDEGWTATSIIDGADPLDIVDAYMRQAERVGLVEQAGSGCSVQRDVATCSAFARSPDPAEPRSVAATVVRGQRADLWSNHVVVLFSTAEIYWTYGDMMSTDEGDIELPPPAPWPSLPTGGDPLPTADEIRDPVEVQEGSRLAGPPRLNIDDATGGMVAILEVTGEPKAVLQRYLEHLASLGSIGADPEVLEVGDALVTQAHASEAGGDDFTVTLVQRPGSPTWLQIEGSHD